MRPNEALNKVKRGRESLFDPWKRSWCWNDLKVVLDDCDLPGSLLTNRRI